MENEMQIAASPRALAPSMAGAQALVQRNLAEVQVAVMMAKQFPRDKIMARDTILNDCCREDLAKVAMYSYARGGQEITGPSIRLAEALKQAWGNMQSGWRELSRGEGQSEVEAWAWDTQNNTRESISFTVKHVRDTRGGGKKLESERDIYELCANQAARRLRACILKMIPGDIVEAAVNQCEATVATKAQATPERIKTIIEMFEQYGVTKGQLEQRIQRRMDSINGPLILSLLKIHNSIKDGMSNANDWFEPEPKKEGDEPQTGTDKVKDSLRTRAAAKAPEPAKPAHDPETGEVLEGATATTQPPAGEVFTQSSPTVTKPISAEAAMPTTAAGDSMPDRKKKAEHLLENLQAADPEDRDDIMAKAGGQNFLMSLGKDGQYDLIKAIKKAAGMA